MGPTGPEAPGAPGAPGAPVGPVLPRSPCSTESTTTRSVSHNENVTQALLSAPKFHMMNVLECFRDERLTHGHISLASSRYKHVLTLTPVAPSLPGGPSDPGVPCQMTEQFTC